MSLHLCMIGVGLDHTLNSISLRFVLAKNFWPSSFVQIHLRFGFRAPRLRRISLEITGNPRSYRVANVEKELGIFLHYTKQKGIGRQLERLEEGFKRLRRLRALPVSIQKKASLVQTNI